MLFAVSPWACSGRTYSRKEGTKEAPRIFTTIGEPDVDEHRTSRRPAPDVGLRWGTPSGSSHYDTTYDTEDEDGAILAGIGSRSLSRLELNETCSVNASPADYLAMLAPFCAIGTLRIKDCYWANEDDLPSKAEGRDIPETGAASTRSLSVRRLELDVGKRTLIWLDLISRTRTVLGGDIAGGGVNDDAYGNAEAGPTLREIAVTCNSVREVQFFGGFLGIAGQTVQEVEIDLGRLYEDDTDEEPGMFFPLTPARGSY